MLSLTRKPGQFIQIGDDIRAHFIDCKRGQTRVSIEAPRNIHIVRSELLEQDEERYRDQ